MTETPDLSTFNDDEDTARRATEAIGIIVAALDAMGAPGSVARRPDTSGKVFMLAYGWFATIVRSGQLVALAHEHGLRHECASNARLVMQHSFALQWVIEGGDAAFEAVAVLAERHKHDLDKELVDSNWSLPAGFTLQAGTKPPKSGALQEQFDNFKAMCALYDGGPQAYVPFRLESASAHPSFTSAMAYINVTDGGVPEPSTTAVSDSFAFLLETGRCVIQAGHALAPLLTDTSLAEAVGKAEAAFGFPVPLWQRLP